MIKAGRLRLRLLKENLIEIKDNQKGFTLIELILTIAIMGLIIVSVLSAYKGVVSTYGVILNKSDSILNARTALNRLIEDIKYAREVNLLDEMGSGRGNFKKIEIVFINSQGQRESVYYYFYSGNKTLYRESNNVSNPVAQVEDLSFSWEDKNIGKIKIYIKVKYNDLDYTFISYSSPLYFLVN